MIHCGHRLSKDIDAFIDDPQYLPLLSPRLGGEEVWGCDAYDETAHYLKLNFPAGQIDFIVSGTITDLPAETMILEGETGASHTVAVEHPVEIALKKLFYRGTMLKVRDIFDIAVVDTIRPKELSDNLHLISHLRSAILNRLDAITEEALRSGLDELAIEEEWRPLATSCLQRVKEIIEEIPEHRYTP